jgi:hypothetical protein
MSIVKFYFVLVVTAILYACGGAEMKESPQASHDTVKPLQRADTLKSNDKIESAYDDEDDDNVVDTSWMAQLYLGSKDTLMSDGRFTVIFKRQLNDSISYCLFNLSGGTCGRTYLASQVSRRHRQLEEVAEGCDSDLGDPFSRYAEYVHDSTQHIITTTTYEERAKPEFLDKNGNFKDGYNMDNAGTIEDTLVAVRKVMPSGVIVTRKVKRE